VDAHRERKDAEQVSIIVRLLQKTTVSTQAIRYPNPFLVTRKGSKIFFKIDRIFIEV
jgi:hypothetical protein